jgi:hypothetical membrane protein
MMIMSSPKVGIKAIGRRLSDEWVFALVMIIIGALFIALGIYRFRVRPEHFGWPNVLACLVGALGAFFMLLVSNYVYHHAPLVFIPWFIFLVYIAFINPYLAAGMGLALWGMLAAQLSG